MKVKLRNPDREVELPGGRPIREMLDELGVDRDTVLVIRAGELVSVTSTPWTTTCSRCAR